MVLRVSDLSVSVDGRALFEPTRFRVEPGARLAIEGPSGVGKTTLLRAVALLIDSTGTIELDGQTPLQIGIPRYRRAVGYVLQTAAMHNGTVLENLRRPFEYKSSTQAYDPDRARALLERLGLQSEHLERMARDLSVGERQRLSLIRALLTQPSFLLLDEPTSALDPDAKSAVEDVVNEFVAEGGGALIVTHDPEQAERWCDARVALARRDAA